MLCVQLDMLFFSRWSTRRLRCPVLFPTIPTTPTSAVMPQTSCTLWTTRHTWIFPEQTFPLRFKATTTLITPPPFMLSLVPRMRKCAPPNTLSSTHRYDGLACSDGTFGFQYSKNESSANNHNGIWMNYILYEYLNLKKCCMVKN